MIGRPACPDQYAATIPTAHERTPAGNGPRRLVHRSGHRAQRAAKKVGTHGCREARPPPALAGPVSPVALGTASVCWSGQPL